MPTSPKLMTIEQVEILDRLKKREAGLVMVQLEMAKKHSELCKARYKATQSDINQMQGIHEDSLYGLDRASCMPLLPLLSREVRLALANEVIEYATLDMHNLKPLGVDQIEILDELKKREAGLAMVQMELANKYPELCKARYKVGQIDIKQMQSVPEDALYGLDRTACMPLLPLLSKDIRVALSNGIVEPVILDLILDKEVAN